MAELDTDLPTRHTSEYTDYTFQRFRAQILMLMREVIDERATSGIANVAFTEESVMGMLTSVWLMRSTQDVQSARGSRGNPSIMHEAALKPGSFAEQKCIGM